MKLCAIAVAFFVVFVWCAFPSGIIGSGNVVEKSYSLSGFDRVSTSSGIRLEIQQSEVFKVELSADDNLIDRIEVKQSGTKLSIGYKNTFFFMSFSFSKTPVVRVSMPSLRGVDASGGSQVEIVMDSRDYEVNVGLSGGAGISGTLVAKKAILEGSGGSRATLTGGCVDMRVDGSGGTQFHLADFVGGNADITVSGGSRAVVYLMGTLDAEASGGSSIVYSGDVKLTKVTMSGGSQISALNNP